MRKINGVNVITPNEFNHEWFKGIEQQKRKKGNPGSREKIRYKNILSAFDIETSRLKEIEQSIMYIWQWAFGPDLVVVGRTWDEFNEFCETLKDDMQPGERLLCLVHNLSFEFQFLKGIYEFKPENVFCMAKRKVLKCSMYGNHIEMRCSYLHSNMNLDTYTKQMGAKHSKLVHRFYARHKVPKSLPGVRNMKKYNITRAASYFGYNYTKRRFPWTDMTDNELMYCINDVIGLVEAASIEMQHDNDNFYTFPLTSTGYVRRDAKKAMQLVNHLWVKKQTPTLHLYEMLREAFRGGNTHANRFFAKELIKYPEDVNTPIHSYDRSSSYPDVIVNCKFPYDKFYEIGSISAKKFDQLYRVMHRAILMRVSIWGLKLKRMSTGCPYLSKDKSREIHNGVYDNGRILQADFLQTTLTDIDYKIIQDMYTWEYITYDDVAYTRYGPLPQPFIDIVNEYYKRKTALKNVPGEELSYFRAKAKLNALYGMMCQAVKQTILFLDGEYVEENKPIEEILYQDNRKRQLPNYQCGVWVTAAARMELQRAINLIEETPGAYFLYCDTDSVKYIGDVDFSEYNKEKIKNSTAHGSFATDPKGIEHFTGVYEKEDDMQSFITLGAKKYAYEDMGGNLHITIAGVIKDKGAREMAKAGGIKMFKPSFIFSEAGGLEAVYNDDPEIKQYEVDGHILPITSNVVLRDSTYTLGITNEYEQLLSICNNYTIDLY